MGYCSNRGNFEFTWRVILDGVPQYQPCLAILYLLFYLLPQPKSERLPRLIMPIGAVLSPLPLASLLLSTVYPCVWGSHTLHIPRGGLLLGGGVPNLLGTSVRGKIHAFCRTSTGRYRQYTTDEAVRRTRFGSRYRLQEEEVDEPIYNARLSIKVKDQGRQYCSSTLPG